MRLYMPKFDAGGESVNPFPVESSGAVPLWNGETPIG